MKTVKELLLAECDYPLAEEVMERFLAPMQTVLLKAKDVLVMSGTVDTNVYVVKEGILRYTYMDGLREVTFGFALPGTMLISMHSFFAHQPVFYQIEACCESEVVKITKSHFDKLVSESHDFARWALTMAHGQLYFYERKNHVINGDAKERFISLIQNRPEIMGKVPLSVVASYLGITQSYLSRLKKTVMPAGQKDR